MQLATRHQVIAINAILAKRGLMEGKKEMMLQFTLERTSSSKELTIDEARELITALNNGIAPTLEQLRQARMARKAIAIARTMGWVVAETIATPAGLVKRNNYTHFKAWLLKYGYLHKDLNKYSYEELPALITQLENVEKDYLNKL